MKNWIYKKYKNIYYWCLKHQIKKLEELITIFEEEGWTNEQRFINLEDALNRLSVKDHNV